MTGKNCRIQLLCPIPFWSLGDSTSKVQSGWLIKFWPMVTFGFDWEIQSRPNRSSYIFYRFTRCSNNNNIWFGTHKFFEIVCSIDDHPTAHLWLQIFRILSLYSTTKVAIRKANVDEKDGGEILIAFKDCLIHKFRES